MDQILLGPKGVAAALEISEKSARLLLKQPGFADIVIGRSQRVTKKKLQTWIDENTVSEVLSKEAGVDGNKKKRRKVGGISNSARQGNQEAPVFVR